MIGEQPGEFRVGTQNLILAMALGKNNRRKLVFKYAHAPYFSYLKLLVRTFM